MLPSFNPTSRTLTLLKLVCALGFVCFVSCLSANGQTYKNDNCHSDYCNWSAILDRTTIWENASGKVILATTAECMTEHKGEDYPEHYTCGSPILSQQAALCSLRTPTFAFKSGSQWQRVKLSISSDGEYGYNQMAIRLYLRICHNIERGTGPLDSIGRRLGYRSRRDAIEEHDQDTIDELMDIRN
jgi:hypothetical protein